MIASLGNISIKDDALTSKAPLGDRPVNPNGRPTVASSHGPGDAAGA